ncbi:MAG TPA: sterol desaturase family protein [Pyrinomonadaceae bacterium]|nr:sterol desaturase family protein [Pyrinomonadaceae bacterium]
MQVLLSDQMRLLVLVGLCGLLWSVESILPLYRYQHRVRHAAPNVALAVILVLMNLALSFTSAYLAAFAVRNGVGLLALFALPAWGQALLGIAALDFFAYLAHLLLHKSWLGWQFHRVHHSENAVDVTTAFRQHPGETVWRLLWQLAAIVVFGIPLPIVIIYLILSALNAQLEHANIKLNTRLDAMVRLIFVTPHMHKAHHSRDQRETDTNYSNIFSLWDRVCGTYTAEVDFRKLRYGLDGFDVEERQTLPGLLKMPFMSYTRT